MFWSCQSWHKNDFLLKPQFYFKIIIINCTQSRECLGVVKLGFKNDFLFEDSILFPCIYNQFRQLKWIMFLTCQSWLKIDFLVEIQFYFYVFIISFSTNSNKECFIVGKLGLTMIFILKFNINYFCFFSTIQLHRIECFIANMTFF